MAGYLKSIGMTNINFVSIVEAHLKEDILSVDYFKGSTKIMIVEDDGDKALFTALGGKLNDIMVFDTCGRLSYYIPFPLSIINARQRAAESAVVSTYTTEICGPPCKNLVIKGENRLEGQEESFKTKDQESSSQNEEILEPRSPKKEESAQSKTEQSGFTQSIWKVWSYVRKVFVKEEEARNKSEKLDIKHKER